MDDLSNETTVDLFERCFHAMTAGEFGKAYALADELCRIVRAGTHSYKLPLPKQFEVWKDTNPEVLQGLTDRIEQYNSFVRG